MGRTRPFFKELARCRLLLVLGFGICIASRSSSLSSESVAAPNLPPAAEQQEPRFLSYRLPLDEPDSHARFLAEAQPSPTGQDQLQSPLPPQQKDESLFSLDYLKLIRDDVKEVFISPAHWDKSDWLLFSGVTAGIVTLGFFDEDIQRAVQRNRNQTLDDIFKAVQPLGAEYSFAIMGGFYLGGALFHDPRAKAVALDSLSASIISGVLFVQPTKIVVGRDRPGVGHGSLDFEPFGGDHSFPSGHATQAFAVATVIAEHYDSIWVKLTSYTLASMVGYARLEQDAHWATDVAAGAAIGTFVGHVVTQFNETHRHLSLTPVIGPGVQAVQLTWSF